MWQSQGSDISKRGKFKRVLFKPLHQAYACIKFADVPLAKAYHTVRLSSRGGGIGFEGVAKSHGKQNMNA